MRIIYAVIASVIWAWVVLAIVGQGGIELPSNDIQILTVAIIAAGAMAGGD